jgi:predicted outer membrane repeat protein
MTISSTVFNGNYSQNNGGAISAHNIKSCTINSNGNSKSNFTNNYTTLGGTKGGALFCNILTTLAITDTTFSSNGYLAGGVSAAITNYGGAISLTGVDNATLSQATIDNNKALEYGGGIICDSSTLTISNNSKITNNKTIGTSSGYGGGIYIDRGTYEISSSTLQNNSAKRGGGIYSLGAGNTTLNLSKTEISNNSSDFYGAGIFLEGSGPTTFKAQSTKFANNTGPYGGAICFNSVTLSPSVINMCRFYKNSSKTTQGGAIYCRLSGTLEINNSIFDWNIGSDGSAVYTEAALTFRNLTFFKNSTSGAGALNSTGGSKIYNSVFWSNSASGSIIDINLGILSVSALNVENSFFDASHSSLNNNTFGGMPSVISPFLSVDSLNSNYLIPTSDLIDKGKGDALYIYGLYDYAGNPRKVGTIDIGAYEAQ